MLGNSFVIKYDDHLQVIINKLGNRSPEKTQAQLKSAVVRLLDTIGYHKMRISTISEEAGLAKGTFYTRFEDKEDIIFNILTEYVKIQTQLMPSIDKNIDVYDSLLSFNTWFANTFRENAGIHRTLMQLSETMPNITAIWDDFSERMTQCYRDALDRSSDQKLDDKMVTMVTYTVGGMLDQTLYAIYATKRSKNYEKASGNIAHLIESVTILQYRAFMLDNPDIERLTTAKDIAKLKNMRETTLD